MVQFLVTSQVNRLLARVFTARLLVSFPGYVLKQATNLEASTADQPAAAANLSSAADDSVITAQGNPLRQEIKKKSCTIKFHPSTLILQDIARCPITALYGCGASSKIYR